MYKALSHDLYKMTSVLSRNLIVIVIRKHRQGDMEKALFDLVAPSLICIIYLTKNIVQWDTEKERDRERERKKTFVTNSEAVRSERHRPFQNLSQTIRPKEIRERSQQKRQW
jgi:hypothetical protein